MSALQPVPIYSMGADEEKAETARLSSFVGAIAIGDLVKSTLGPKGMDKILCTRGPGSQESVIITNDGATIMKAIGVDNPAAKVLVDISKVQDSEVGDGTTSVVVLTSELLRQAEVLIARKLHPQTIISGWRQGLEAAKRALFDAARECTEANLREDLQKLAETTISSKIISQHKLHFATLAVDAMQRVWNKEDPTSSLELISIVKKLGGTLRDSYLDEGFLLEKKIGVNQPKYMEECRILIANTQMDTDKVKVFGGRVRVDSTAKVAELELAEKQKMKEKVDLILKHNINVFVNRQLIYNYPEQLFADVGVMAIEHADFEGVERLARALDGEIVSTFHNPEKVKLGHCKAIEEVIIGEDKFIHFSGVAGGRACTVVLRGATQQILDEADRSLHDALCVLQQTLKEPRIIYGGGSGEMLMARAVQELADKFAGKESISIEALANALRQLPTIMVDNAGYDSADLITNLRASYSEGKKNLGVDMSKGTVGDMEKLGIIESYRVKLQMLVSAVEAAEMLLRVDNIIRSAPRQRTEDNRPC